MVKEYLIPTLRSTDLIPIGLRIKSETEVHSGLKIKSDGKLAPIINKKSAQMTRKKYLQ